MAEARRPGVRALALGVGACLALAYSLLLLGDPLVETLAASESGLVENAGAAAFLGSSILFALAYTRSRRRAYLVLAFVFFVAAGEEASWGQHALGLDAPDAIDEVNAQEELTIHNLNPIQRIRNEVGFDVVFALFIALALAYTVGVPRLAARSAPARRALARWVPIVPATFGILVLANLALFALAGVLSPADRSHAVTEIAEMGFAAVFLAVAIDAAAAQPARPPAPISSSPVTGR